MNIQQAAASLIVPVEAPADGAPANDASEALLNEAGELIDEEGQGDTRTDEQKLIDELAAEEGGEEDEAPADVPPPPHSWSKEDAKAWEGLTPEARDVVLRREAERDRFVAETGRKSAAARQAVERQAMEAVAQHAEDYAQRVAFYAQQMLPAQPDQRLLYTGDQNDVIIYQRQQAAYQNGLAQHQQMQQEAEQAKQQANAAREQAQQSLQQEEAQRLADQLPEWNDPSARAKLLSELEGVGSELGYPAELMAEAGATDILALKKAAEWRSDAMKYRKIMGKRMETVRSAKALPTMTRPGAGGVRGVHISADDKQGLIDRFNRERSPEAAAALLMTRTR